MRIAVVLLFAAEIARACSCSGGAYAPLCQRIDSVEVLFIGAAIATNDKQDGYARGGVWYRFSVQEIFRGLPAGTRQVIVNPSSGTSCQEDYSIGKRYLMSSYSPAFADRTAAVIFNLLGLVCDGKWRSFGLNILTSVCGRSRLVGDAADDVAFIRQYVSSPQPASIAVFVRSPADEVFGGREYPPLPGVRIVVRSANGETTGTTDAEGRFQLQGVAPGKYSLSASAKGYKSLRTTYELEVPAHGCGIANIGMVTQAGISGRVLRGMRGMRGMRGNAGQPELRGLFLRRRRQSAQ